MRKVKKRIITDPSTLVLMEEHFWNIPPTIEEQTNDNLLIDVEFCLDFTKEDAENENSFILNEGALFIILKVAFVLEREEKELSHYVGIYGIQYNVLGNHKLTEKMTEKENLLTDKLMTKMLKKAEISFASAGFTELNLLEKMTGI